jgi:Holliday junction resolvase
MRPGGQKRKGDKFERWVVSELLAAGAHSRRQPGSGAIAAFPADVLLEVPGIGRTLIECKSHKSPLKTIRNWLGAATVLVHKANNEPALVTMPFDVYTGMIGSIVMLTEEASRKNGYATDTITDEAGHAG